MNVTVMSRWDAVFYCYEPHDVPTAMISISDPNMQYAASPFCSEENKVLELLPLCFADANQPGLDVYRMEAREEDLMLDEDAARVAELLRNYPNTNIIVHCDAGLSRSAGVAAAILDIPPAMTVLSSTMDIMTRIHGAIRKRWLHCAEQTNLTVKT